MIETKRLKIYTASRDEMEGFIKLQTVEELKMAYTEMMEVVKAIDYIIIRRITYA